MKSVFNQELIIIINDSTWRIVFFVLAFLIVISALNGSARNSQILEISENLNKDEMLMQGALQDSVRKWENEPEGDPPSVTSPGVLGLSILSHYAVLPSTALRSLSTGQADVQMTYYRITAHPSLTFINDIEIKNPLNALSGSFDVAFVIIFLLPIFVIATNFDIMSKEKELGVLSLIIAHGISKTRFIIARVCARALLMITLILFSGLLSVVLVESVLVSFDLWLRFILWFITVVLYSFFWFALALFVNAWNRPSVTNGVILANLWVVFVVVLPAMVNIVATTSYPAPSRVELTTEMREATQVADQEAAEAREDFFFDHPEMASDNVDVDQFFIQLLATDAAVEKVIQPLLDEFQSQSQKRQNIVNLLQYLSPAILTQNILNDISGTSTGRFSNFLRQVLDFHETWRDFFTKRITAGQVMTSQDYNDIPVFYYQEVSLRYLLTSAGIPLVGLIFFILLLSVWGTVKFRNFAIV